MLFTLIDCNNFYASCERVFNPQLQDKPIVVLSSNDGCVIARSAQAKQLGIPMGVPYFKIAKLCQYHQVKIFSSNYALYGDMSRRVMDILQADTPHLEIYSIDEAFLQYELQPMEHLLEHAQQLRQKILQWTGLPTCIGIAPTKTLAKAANHIAKKETLHGVVGWKHAREWEPILARLALADIWGIGSCSAAKLLTLGISTPLELAQAPIKWIRRHFSVVMERIVHELNGTPCYGLEFVESREPQQQIMASRSFGQTVTTLPDLIAAGCHHTARAFETLRQQQQLTTRIQVFVTQAFKNNISGDTNMMTYRFSQPTQDTRHACQAVTHCVTALFTPGKSYKKVGVLLAELTDPQYQNQDLFLPQASIKAPVLMATLDKINLRLGRNTLFLAAQGIQQPWKMRSSQRSPGYTTRWDHLVGVN